MEEMLLCTKCGCSYEPTRADQVMVCGQTEFSPAEYDYACPYCGALADEYAEEVSLCEICEDPIVRSVKKKIRGKEVEIFTAGTGHFCECCAEKIDKAVASLADELGVDKDDVLPICEMRAANVKEAKAWAS